MTSSSFSVSKYSHGDGTAWLAIRGEIDGDVDDAVTTIIANAARQRGTTALIVDLGEVPFLAAAGITALMEGRCTAMCNGLSYRVVNARGVVRSVLEAAGLHDPLRLGELRRRPAALRPA